MGRHMVLCASYRRVSIRLHPHHWEEKRKREIKSVKHAALREVMHE
jgi:hypothetical protein